MRKLDLDMVRPQIGEFVFEGETFRVMKPTIGQLLTRRKEYDITEKELKKLEPKGNESLSSIYMERLTNWKSREIQIFIPEFKKVDNLTEDQRDALLRMIFEVDEEAEVTENSKKKRQQRAKG
jgi:hypothetical protein